MTSSVRLEFMPMSMREYGQKSPAFDVVAIRPRMLPPSAISTGRAKFRMNNLSGSAADLKLYAYGADGKLAEVGKELWTITDEAGTGVDTLADGTLYELRVSVADGGAFDLSEAEKEIKISVVLAK